MDRIGELTDRAGGARRAAQQPPPQQAALKIKAAIHRARIGVPCARPWLVLFIDIS